MLLYKVRIICIFYNMVLKMYKLKIDKNKGEIDEFKIMVGEFNI